MTNTNETFSLISSLPVVYTTGDITIHVADRAVGPSTYYYTTRTGKCGGGASEVEALERGIAACGGTY